MEFKEIPFVKQLYDKSCGASCIEMLYKYYGIEDKQEYIWDRIKGRYNPNSKLSCIPDKIINELRNKGLNASSCSSSKLESFINTCIQADIDVMILYRQKDSHTDAHFSVLVKKEGGSIYVNNPEPEEKEGFRQRIRILELSKLMKKKRDEISQDIIMDNVFIVVSKSNSNMSAFKCPNCGNDIIIFTVLSPLLDNALCVSCKMGFSLKGCELKIK